MRVYFELIDTSEYECRVYLQLYFVTPYLNGEIFYKPFFLNIILTHVHVTKGLRILCLWLSVLGGLDVPFTQEPHNPSYFENGTEANLVWDYTDPHNNIQSIFYSVLVHDVFVTMLVNDSHGVQEHSSIPQSYRGRVKIEGRATLVIKNINPADNTKFKCELE